MDQLSSGISAISDYSDRKDILISSKFQTSAEELSGLGIVYAVFLAFCELLKYPAIKLCNSS